LALLLRAGRFAAMTTAAAALAACGAATSPTAPTAPTEVRLGPGSTFDELVLTWTPPTAGRVTGYEVEANLAGGAWERLPGQAPGDSIGALFSLLPEAPELVTVGARVRALDGTAASPFSEPATHFRGLRPLSSATAVIEGEERIRLDWSQGSTAGPQVRIERSVYDDSTFTQGEFVTVATVAPGSTTWLDASSLLPGSSVTYRLTNLAAYQGTPVESVGLQAAPGLRPVVSAPIDLQVSLLGGAPVLTWTNRSLAATALRVERTAGYVTADLVAQNPLLFVPVATLPPDATTFTDTVPVGTYTYRVAALRGELPGPSAPAQAVVPPAGLDVALVDAPWAEYATRDGDGALWLAPRASPTRLYLPGAIGWTTHSFDPVGSAIGQPGPVFDAAGHPHVAYLVAIPGGGGVNGYDVVHAWNDGTAWQQEVAARTTVAYGGSVRPRLFLALGPGGEPHLAWQPNARAFPQHAVRSAAGWTVETLASTLYDANLGYDLWDFAAGPDGSLHAAVVLLNRLVLASRPPGGAWAEELAPTSGNLDWGDETARLMPFDGGVAVAYKRFVQSDLLPMKLTVLTREAGGWGPEEEVAAFDKGGAGGVTWSAAAAGGRRAILLPQGEPEGLWLHRWSAADGWGSTRLRQWTEWDPTWLGFTQAGRVWVLAPSGPRSGADPSADFLHRYLSFAEP